jgi:hypothetical protein
MPRVGRGHELGELRAGGPTAADLPAVDLVDAFHLGCCDLSGVILVPIWVYPKSSLKSHCHFVTDICNA